MPTYSAKALVTAAQELVQAGVIEWSKSSGTWWTASGEFLTLTEVDALCVAHLTAAEKAEAERAKKRRGGRPAKPADKKLKCVSAMVSPECHEELRTKAEEFGMTISLLVRRILDKPTSFQLARATQHSLTQEDQRVQRQLAGASGSLYQLAQQAKAEGMQEVEEEVLAICRDLRAILKR